MARHFAPPVPQRDLPRPLYELLRRLGLQLRGQQGAIAAIGRGETPDGSGDPIVDLSGYFKLAGRPGGQFGRGATESGGNLTLGSTAHSTKGYIYLGAALASAYDEGSDRLGIKTATPAGVVHIVGEAPSSTSIRASSQLGDHGVWFGEDGVNPPASTNLHTFVNEVTANDSTYVHGDDPAGGTQGVTFQLTGATDPGVNTGHVVRIRARHATGTSSHIKVTWTLSSASLAIKTVNQELAGSFATYETTLSDAEVIAITDYGDMTFGFVDGYGGTPGSNGRVDVSWFELEIPGGTGAGVGGITLLVDAGLNQATDLTQWRDSSGDTLSGTTINGNYYLTAGAAVGYGYISDADGVGSWQTLAHNLLSSTHSDTLTATVIRGDLLIGNATPKWSRLPIGASGTLLRSNGTDPAWTSVASAIAHPILDGSIHSDSVAQAVSQGSLIVGNATPKWDELTIGAAGTLLTSDGTAPAWATAPVTDPLDLTERTVSNPSTNIFRVYAREAGARIQLVSVSSTGQECILCDLSDFAHVNTLAFNDIEP